MEEVTTFLGHQPSRLAIKRVNKHGKPIARDCREPTAAYSVGAALIRLKAIRRTGKTSKSPGILRSQPRAGRIPYGFSPLGRANKVKVVSG